MRKSRDLELGPFLNSLSVIVPSYQRDYVWGDVQIYDLLKEIDYIFDNKKVNLEHIVPINYNESYEIPEEEYDLYIHSLGNMTLLNESANKTIKDSNWSEKKEAYKELNISITKKLSEQESFTKEDIIKRTDALLDEFLKILSSLLEEK